MSSTLDTTTVSSRSRSKLSKTRNQLVDDLGSQNSDLQCVVVNDLQSRMTQHSPLSKVKVNETLAQENLRLVRRIKELEDSMRLSNYKSNGGVDTSSNFALVSEFKSKWEEFAREQIMDTFGEFFNQTPKIINQIVALAQIVGVEETNLEYENKVQEVAQVLNVSSKSNEVERSLMPLLRNNYRETFHELNELVLKKYFIQLEAAFGPKAIPILDILKENDSSSLKKFFQSFKELLLHLKLNDPPLFFKPLDLLQPTIQKPQVDQTAFIIDGFDKDNCNHLILLHQPFTQSSFQGSYAGLKPAVLVIPDQSPVKIAVNHQKIAGGKQNTKVVTSLFKHISEKHSQQLDRKIKRISKPLLGGDMIEVKPNAKKQLMAPPAQGKILVVSAVIKEGKRTITRSQERNKKREFGETITMSNGDLHNQTFQTERNNRSRVKSPQPTRNNEQLLKSSRSASGLKTVQKQYKQKSFLPIFGRNSITDLEQKILTVDSRGSAKRPKSISRYMQCSLQFTQFLQSMNPSPAFLTLAGEYGQDAKNDQSISKLNLTKDNNKPIKISEFIEGQVVQRGLENTASAGDLSMTASQSNLNSTKKSQPIHMLLVKQGSVLRRGKQKTEGTSNKQRNLESEVVSPNKTLNYQNRKAAQTNRYNSQKNSNLFHYC